MKSTDSPTDLELVRGLQARDRQAFARVYGDYHAAVYNLCARILGDREEAKDVTQDVFLKAFDRPPAASTDVRLRPWLFRVATNACFNVVRGRRTGGPLEVEALPAAGDPYEQARSVELIEGSLAAMNERYRAALVLKDLHGVGGSELADVLAISRPAADVLVHRARASFRRAFAALAGDGSAAPANLALVLPTLTVPASLHALPLPPAALAPATHGPAPAGPILADPGAAAAAGAGPAVGILAKITAGLSAKAAVVAAGAVVVAGGGVAAVELAGNGATAPASTRRRAGSAGPPRLRGRRPRRAPQPARRLGEAQARDRGPPRRRQPLRPCRTRDERRALWRPRRRDCRRRVDRRRPYDVDVLGPLGADVFWDDDPRHDDIDHVDVRGARRRRARRMTTRATEAGRTRTG